MAFDFDEKIHVYSINGDYDKFLTKREVLGLLTVRQWNRLFDDGFVSVDGYIYEL